MDKVATYRSHIQQILKEFGAALPTSQEVETQYIFDTERDHYQLFQVGWEQFDWIHGCILHLDIKQNKIWIQHNGTEFGVADELVALGVPKEDIVLGFQAPYKRKYTGYAEN
ncbi:MAG: XisI protein [Caldilinea sp. CFX5]|nr:XisI protein [Caldilinea sp. CFX5]